MFPQQERTGLRKTKPSAWSQQAAGVEEFILIAVHLERDLSCFPALENRFVWHLALVMKQNSNEKWYLWPYFLPHTVHNKEKTASLFTSLVIVVEHCGPVNLWISLHGKHVDSALVHVSVPHKQHVGGLEPLSRLLFEITARRWFSLVIIVYWCAVQEQKAWACQRVNMPGHDLMKEVLSCSTEHSGVVSVFSDSR